MQDGLATVQLKGVIRVAYVSPAPTVGDAVVLSGSGAVKQAGTGEPGRGVVLAVDGAASTCDVLL